MTKLKVHSTLQAFMHALMENKPVAIYEGGICNRCFDQDKSVLLHYLVEKSKSKIVGTRGCDRVVSIASRTGKLFVNSSAATVEKAAETLASMNQRDVALSLIEEIFCLKLKDYDPFTDIVLKTADIAKALGVSKDSKTEYREILIALDNAFIQKRIGILDDLSLYGAKSKDNQADPGALVLTHQPVQGGFIVDENGKVFGHARAEIAIPFSKGALLDEIIEKAKLHNLYLSEHSYGRDDKKAAFVIDGEMDSNFHKEADLKTIPPTVYVSSDNAAHSLHRKFFSDQEESAENMLYESRIKSEIADALNAEKTYLAQIEEILSEQK